MIRHTIAAAHRKLTKREREWQWMLAHGYLWLAQSSVSGSS